MPDEVYSKAHIDELMAAVGTHIKNVSGKPAPDDIDDADATHFYMGWENIDDGWLVRRQLRDDASTQDATSGYPDLAAAWADRVNLGYV